jgi:hypothetical protein
MWVIFQVGGLYRIIQSWDMSMLGYNGVRVHLTAFVQKQ